MILPSSFYDRDTLIVARQLLGSLLVHESSAGRLAGLIVETEAYLHDDPAAHTFRGQSPRNAVMFGPPGHAYMYFTYGMHWCLNAVTRPAGVGEGVLLRALQPIEGIKTMRQNRGLTNELQLCNGPAKLVQALGLTPALRGHDLTQPPLWIETGSKPDKIVATTRIGISRAQQLPHRFYIEGNQFVSRP